MKSALVPRPFTGGIEAQHGNTVDDPGKIGLMRGILLSEGREGIASVLRAAHGNGIDAVALHGIADVVGGEIVTFHHFDKATKRPYGIFACPAQREFGELHYAVNNYINYLSNRSVKQVKMPSRRYFILEHNYSSGGSATNWYVLYDRIDFIRHDGMTNILFLAGNVGSFRKGGISSVMNNYEWGYNYDN